MSEIKDCKGSRSTLAMAFMDNKREMAVLEAEQGKLKMKIDARMVLNNCKVLFYNGEYVQKADNPKVSIDVAKFKSATNAKEFMQCVKVDVKKARKVLSEGQVEQILITKSGDKFITGVVEY
jgi:hypothetical protein